LHMSQLYVLLKKGFRTLVMKPVTVVALLYERLHRQLHFANDSFDL